HAGPELRRATVRLVLLRQHGADLPGRCADGESVPIPRPSVGPVDGGNLVHDLRGALPGCRAVVVESPGSFARRRLGAGEPRLALRQRTVRTRVAALRAPAARAAGS